MFKPTPLVPIMTFQSYLRANDAYFNGEEGVKCIRCFGEGTIFDPNDPPDVYEGNKLRKVITCTACDGMKVGVLSSWKVQHKKIVDYVKEQNKRIALKNALIESATKKLNEEERKVLGL